MKRNILFSCALMAATLCIQAQSPTANKIVSGLQGAGAPCRTPDGQNGRYYPQTVTTTTTTTTMNGTSTNSGANSVTVSNGVNAGLTNAGVSAGSSRTSTSGSSTQNNSNTVTTTVQGTAVCVPYKK